MDEKKENLDAKKSTLTLSSKTLTLGKSFDSGAIKRNISKSTSGAVTVVKKKRFAHKESIAHDKVNSELAPAQVSVGDADKSILTNSERDNRIRALQQASSLKELEEIENIQKENKKAQKLEKLSESNIPDEEAQDENTKSEVAIEEVIQPDALSEKEDIKKTLLKDNKPDVYSGDEESDEETNKAKIGKVIEKVKRNKFEESRRSSKKISIQDIFSEDTGERTRSLASVRRARAKAKKRDINDELEKIVREVVLPEVINVQELANRMSEKVSNVIRELMKLGMLVTASQTIDADTAEIIIDTFGHKVKRVSESDVEKVLVQEVDESHDMTKRAPVVTVMGHVDHGKTSLLDAIRSTDVVSGEAGGITQHIGAYRIKLPNGEYITFIDTPGHEAFTEMRSRGAKATDIVVLVVAADDGIMQQTIEAINHAKAAKVPIIVAVNKIDKPGADSDRIRSELLQHDLVPEQFGGDIMVVDVSAKNKINIDKLEETILLQAEVMDLKANYNAKASGVVVESKVDKGKGIVATVLVQRGTLRTGDIIVAGSASGKVRLILDDKGGKLDSATPSMPVEVLGLSESPLAGEEFAVVENDKVAKDIGEYRKQKARGLKVSVLKKSTLEELFSKAGGDSRITELPIIIKADTQGSIEAIAGTITKINSEELTVNIIHHAVGGITESDVALAAASRALVIGFNVRGSVQVVEKAKNEGVDIRYYSIIYNLVDDIKLILSGMLKPILREEFIGSVEIRKVYNITKVGKIAGSYVKSGTIKRGAGVRLLRDNIVIHEGKLKTLKRFKEDVKEVKEGFECGIAFENYDDIKEHDYVEVYETTEEKRTIE
jgi:translation initiation factor IF-2